MRCCRAAPSQIYHQQFARGPRPTTHKAIYSSEPPLSYRTQVLAPQACNDLSVGTTSTHPGTLPLIKTNNHAAWQATVVCNPQARTHGTHDTYLHRKVFLPCEQSRHRGRCVVSPRPQLLHHHISSKCLGEYVKSCWRSSAGICSKVLFLSVIDCSGRRMVSPHRYARI